MSDTPPDAGGKIRALVAAHIEPVTRFDAADLSAASPEQAYPVELELTLAQQVSFGVGRQAGAARLPSGIEKVSGQSAFEAELAQRLLQAQKDAPTAVQNWAQANPGSYRRLMPARSGFLRQPGTVGYEHTCTTCSGACRVTCPACFGKGRTMCYGCHGSGKINCHSCHGSKKLTCSSCHGRGSWSEQVSESTWSYATNSYVTSYRTEHRYCSACSSSGHTTCHSCGYDGKIACSSCGGQGHLNCAPCHTSGKIDCSACLASGIQHMRGTIDAQVTHTEQLSIATAPGRLHELIGLLPRESLPDFGALMQVQHTPNFRQVQTRHTLRLDVREAQLQAGHETFTLYGFGPEAHVLSFENIAGHMLLDDLVHLEQCVTSSSRWRRQRGGDLLETTADFLRSELNLLIAEKVADLSISPDEAAQAVEEHFSGLVDADYVRRSTLALRGALARLYGSELLESAASLCGLTGLAAALQYGVGWPQIGPWPAMLWSLAGGTLAWLGLEWLTRRRIARRFEHDFGRRVVKQLSANGSVKRWRIGMGVALVASVWLAVLGANILPPVRARQQELSARAATQNRLDEWFSAQAQADLRQRFYPAHAQLVTQAEAGDQRALMALVWQLLLGTDDTPKDVAAAAQWLDKASPDTTRSALWQTAKAVRTLNQDAMPDDLRAAAQSLKEASDQGLEEARYWLARLYLAEQSPVHDARLGLQTLTLAADHQHAHAALMLGQKYAKGEGVRRNTQMARRYLLVASGAGLQEGTKALSALR